MKQDRPPFDRRWLPLNALRAFEAVGKRLNVTAAFDDGYGYFLDIHPEDLADPAIAAFRSWIIQRFASPKPTRLRSVKGDKIA